MKALINTLNLTVNIHRDAPEATSHDKADLAEFLMAMSQMELFPECDEECDEAPADAHSPVVTPDNVAEVISGLSATLSESTEAATPVMDFGNATVHVAIPNSGSSSGYILGTDRHAINRLALRDAPDGELVVSSFSPLFNLVLRSRKPHRHVVLNLYTEKFGTTVHASEEKAQQYADAEATQVKAVLVSAADARDLIGSPEAVALRLDQKLCMLAAHTTSLTTYAIGDSRNAGQQLSVREAYQRAVEGSTMVLVPTNSWMYQAISSGDAAPRHMVWVNYYTKSGNHGHTVYPSRQEAHDHANTSTAEVHQRCYAVYEVCNFREAIDMNFPGHMDSADDAPAMDFNTPTPPAPVMDFNTPTQPADSMDFNTLHAERLQEKLCMRLTDNYREVGQAIDDSRLKDKQASVIDACRSVIDEDTKVLVPENSWVFRMMDTTDVYVWAFRRWVNYYVASDNYGATAYSTEQEAREQSTDSSQAVVQVPFIELSVELLRVKLRIMGVTFN